MLFAALRSRAPRAFALNVAQTHTRLAFAARTFRTSMAMFDGFPVAVVKRDAVVSWGWPDNVDEETVRKTLGVDPKAQVATGKDKRNQTFVRVVVGDDAEANALVDKLQAAPPVVAGMTVTAQLSFPFVVKNANIYTNGWPQGTDANAVRSAMGLSEDLPVRVQPGNSGIYAHIDFPSLEEAEAVIRRYEANPLSVAGRPISVRYGKRGPNPLGLRVDKFEHGPAGLRDMVGSAASHITDVRATSDGQTLYVDFKSQEAAEDVKRILEGKGFPVEHTYLRPLSSKQSRRRSIA